MSKTATAVRERTSAPRRLEADGENLDWSLLSSHGKVVLYLALCPESTIQQIARGLDRTERAVARTVASLRRSGILRARTANRRKLFSVNLDASMFHPTLSGFTLRQLFGKLQDQVRHQGLEICDRDIP